MTWQDRKIEKKKKTERIVQRGYTKVLFFTHSILLKGSRRDDSNYTLKDHKKIVINPK